MHDSPPVLHAEHVLMPVQVQPPAGEATPPESKLVGVLDVGFVRMFEPIAARLVPVSAAMQGSQGALAQALPVPELISIPNVHNKCACSSILIRDLVSRRAWQEPGCQ